MASIEVTAEKTSEGWVLLSADEFRDTLAGPFPDEKLVAKACKELDLKIKKKQKTVADMQPGWLFRIDGYWYRFVNLIPGNRNALLNVVGENRSENVSTKTPVTEVSVLSLS